MNKKLMFVLAFVAIAVLTVGLISSGAWWSVQTQATENNYQAATFDMTIGGTGTHTVVGACGLPNMAPGDDPAECKIALHNASSIPINVVWSGFALTGDPTLANFICVTAFADSNSQTSIDQFASYKDPTLNCVTLTTMAGLLANGYFSNPDGTDSHASIFLPTGPSDGWVSLTFAFSATAPNSTIGKQVSFTWTLTGQQLPKIRLPNP